MPPLHLSTPRKALYATLSLLLVAAAFEAVPRAGGWVLLQRVRNATDTGDEDLRVLCVGDSYTYGMGTMPSLYSWPRQLEGLLRERNPALEASVRNAGLPGRSSGEILADLPDLLDETRPHVVCVLVGLNNIWKFREPKWPAVSFLDPTRNRLRHLWVYRFLHWTLSRLAPHSWLTGARSTPEKQPRPEPVVAKPYRPGQAGLIRGLRGPREVGSSAPETLRRAAYHQLRSDMASMASQVSTKGAVLVIATYPEGRSPPKRGRGGPELLETVQKEIAARHSLPVANVRPAFTAAKEKVGRDRLISPDGSHPSGEGYSVVAEVVYGAVLEACRQLSSPIVLAPPPPQSNPRAPDFDSSVAQAELHRWSKSARTKNRSLLWLVDALMLADAGRLDEAIASMERHGADVEPHNLASRMLAGFYRRAGRLKDERSFCERMVALDPDLDYYRNRLAELDSLEAVVR